MARRITRQVTTFFSKNRNINCSETHSKKSCRFMIDTDDEGSQEKYLWSGDVDILAPETIDFIMRSSKPGGIKFLRLSPQKDGLTTYFILEECAEQTNLVIHNGLEDLDVHVYQANVNMPIKFNVKRGRSSNFAWEVPFLDKREIQLDFVDASGNVSKVPERVDLDLLEIPQEISFSKARVRYSCEVIEHDGRKIVRILEVKRESIQRAQTMGPPNTKKGGQQHKKEIIVGLANVGVSFVGTIGQARMEVFYLTLVGCELAVIENTEYYSCQARVKFISVDANCQPRPVHPVMLTSGIYEELCNFDVYAIDSSFTFLKKKSTSHV